MSEHEQHQNPPVLLPTIGFALAAIVSVVLGLYLLLTLPTLSAEIRDYEDQRASIERTQAALDNVYSAQERRDFWTRKMPETAAERAIGKPPDPQARALKSELTRLESTLPKEPPAGYGAFLAKYGSPPDRQWWHSLGIVALIGCPVFFILSVLGFYLWKHEGFREDMIAKPRAQTPEHPRMQLVRAFRDMGTKTGGTRGAQWFRVAADLEAGHTIAELKARYGEAFDDPIVQKALRGIRLD